MRETPDDLLLLQRRLDDSYDRAGEHIRSIFRPERRLDAQGLADALQGVFLLNLATVTAEGAPFVAPLDGLFYRGQVWFGFPPGSVRGGHVRARPQVSATCTRDAKVCLIVHGTAREADLVGDHADADRFIREIYGPIFEQSAALYVDRAGPSWDGWIDPERIFAMVPPPEG